jgi:formylglycine-generating enzyme required for sulfatase activity
VRWSFLLKEHLVYAALIVATGCSRSTAPAKSGGTFTERAEANVPHHRVTIAAAGNVAFAPTVFNTAPPTGHAPAGMVWIPGGEFSMGAGNPTGSDHNQIGMLAAADARPVHRVYVDSFWMDRTEVTNAEFARFVAATGYVTVAERAPTREEFPKAPPDALVPGSLVFTAPDRPVPLDSYLRWWAYVKGADWHHPEGPGSSIEGRENHPVVQVAYQDALAYAMWVGKRLPTEAEWEFAARGGLSGMVYPWGDDFSPEGKSMTNSFQGHFPDHNERTDGYMLTAPVASFPPNGYGLYDVAGNVWEWVSDWYRPDYYAQLAKAAVVARNPKGPDSSYDPDEPGVRKRVQRGGSFLCTNQYCSRYMVGSRGKGEVDSGTNHLGFRLVLPIRSGAAAEGKTSGVPGGPLNRAR